MKIAKEFRAFLEMHQHLYLPQIGRFEITIRDANETGVNGILDFITFVADKNQAIDMTLIEFTSDHLKVESCVAESDLNCFCNSVNELLLQGFEAEVPGIGYLHYETGNKLQFSVKSIYHSPVEKKRKRIPTAFTAAFWI